jgi:zinc/manganese transport system permease protein
VFATLIVPPLATRRMRRWRLAASWVIAALGYIAGLLVSTATDLPTGAVIVWTLVVAGLAWYPFTQRFGAAREEVPA